MKVCILGAGALGSSIGGILTEAGLEVHLIDPWAEHLSLKKVIPKQPWVQWLRACQP